MAVFDFGGKFKEHLKPALEKFAIKLGTIFATKSYVDTQISNVQASALGRLTGSSATFAGLPTTFTGGGSIANSDYAILTEDDGSYESGIYSWDGSAFVFVCDLVMANEAGVALATDAEFSEGTSTTKAVSVKQAADSFAKKAGDTTQVFNVAKADDNSTTAVRADQFGAPMTSQEATDWVNTLTLA